MKQWTSQRLVILIAAVLTLSGASLWSAVRAQERESSGDVLIIENEGYSNRKKGPVEFPHLKHAMDAGISCWDCHHEYNGGENVWAPWRETKACVACHETDRAAVSEIRLQKAYHLSCKKCHQELVEEQKQAGEFRKCKGCHMSGQK